MNRKIVFLDIDGTLTDFTGHLPESAADALAKAKKNGHELVICTGRTITQIYPMLLNSGLFTGIVCGAGSDVRYQGEVVCQHFIDTQHLQSLLDYLEAVGAYYYLQCVSGVYATKRVIERSRILFAGDSADPKKRERLFGKTFEIKEPWKREDVNKMAFYQADTDIETIRREAGSYFDVMESSFRLTEKLDGEITAAGYDKAFGMRKFLEAAGGREEDTIAFGDGPNDHEMLSFAHTGVAMGNGEKALKERADMVTDRIEEDGLAHAFEKLGLI